MGVRRERVKGAIRAALSRRQRGRYLAEVAQLPDEQLAAMDLEDGDDDETIVGYLQGTLGGGAVFGADAAAGSPPASAAALVAELSSDNPELGLFTLVNKVTGASTFYLDPGLGVSKQLLEWLSSVHTRFQESKKQLHPFPVPQRPAIVSGLTKTGKSTTASEFLPALIGAYGIKDHTAALASGALPARGQAEGGLECCFWFVSCIGFDRQNGVAGFAASMFDDLQDIACKLGFSAATQFPTDNREAENIIELFERLPADRVHLIVVDEVQAFFLMEDGSRELDRAAVRASRGLFKELITASPPHVAWVFTGSMMMMTWANIAETPTNGYAPLMQCQHIHLPSTVSEEVFAMAWGKLRAQYPSIPEELLLVVPRNHALLAYLCQEFTAVPQRPSDMASVLKFVTTTLSTQLLPAMAADLRMAFEAMENATYYGCSQTGEDLVRTQLGTLQQLFDPARVQSYNKLHPYFAVMFGPYLEPISKEDKPEGVDSQGRGLMYVNSPFHQQLLQMATVDGRLIQGFEQFELQPDTYWELERYRRFGDLCSAARQREYKEYEFVLEQLKEMATALEHLGYIFDQAWFQE